MKLGNTLRTHTEQALLLEVSSLADLAAVFIFLQSLNVLLHQSHFSVVSSLTISVLQKHQ